MLKPSIAKFLERWLTQSSPFLALFGLLYLLVYALQVVFWDDPAMVQFGELASNIIWWIFALDLVIRFIVAQSFGAFLKANVLEFVALVIPFLRILRVFRVLIALRGLKPYLKSRFASTVVYILVLLPLTWFTGAVVILDVERGISGSTITNLPDALWWSLTTITTVGYGDLYPQSTEGKFVAAILMILGIGLFSAGAGMFGNWLLNENKEKENV